MAPQSARPYPHRSLLALRQHDAEQAQQALAHALSAESDARNAAQASASALADAQTHEREVWPLAPAGATPSNEGGRQSGATLRQRSAYARRVAEAVREARAVHEAAQRQLQLATSEVARAREALTAASQREQVLSRDAERHQAHQRRSREQAELDEQQDALLARHGSSRPPHGR